MRKELYEDLLKKEPEHGTKEYKEWQERLHESIGWSYPSTQDTVFVDGNDVVSSPLGETKTVWDVHLAEGGFTCKDQDTAKLLSLIVQMNERMKRMENNIIELRKVVGSVGHMESLKR